MKQWLITVAFPLLLGANLTASAAVSKGPPMWRISRLFGKLDTDQPTG